MDWEAGVLGERMDFKVIWSDAAIEDLRDICSSGGGGSAFRYVAHDK